MKGMVGKPSDKDGDGIGNEMVEKNGNQKTGSYSQKTILKRRPNGIMKKTNSRKGKGAKSIFLKGKLTGAKETDSSQIGIKEFLTRARGLNGIKGISQGRLNSPGI